MEQLSGLDSLFLYAESENVHQHVSAFGIYDSSTFPGGTIRFRHLLAHFERRLNTSKIFRRRLLTVPHNLDRPYWIDDPDIDIEFHVRHIALPHPGDRRQLMIQLARLHSRALDLGKPRGRWCATCTLRRKKVTTRCPPTRSISPTASPVP